jgi:hypothetical protein
MTAHLGSVIFMSGWTFVLVGGGRRYLYSVVEAACRFSQASYSGRASSVSG